MKKTEYIQLLIEDNKTASDKTQLYNDLIDCVELALSQTRPDFVINSSIGLKELFAEIEKKAKESRKGNYACIGPFEAAEIIAAKLGAKYERATMQYSKNNGILNLEDFF